MSLRRRLLAALLGAVVFSGVVASAATYYLARAEAGALLDEELRQVALSLRDHAVVELGMLAPAPEDFDRRVVVQIWDRFGFTSYLSNSRTPLPPARRAGFSTVLHESREWRVFTLHTRLRTIQAAQTTAERDDRAAGAALRTLIPVLGALPLLAVLIWLVLDRGFAPLARLTRAVRARTAADLAPLPLERVPDEIQPLVAGLNNLLSRLSDAFTAQRRFAADAAHELRTPLTALTLQIQLVERARTDDARAAAVARLKERAKRAARLLQQLLVMARLEPEAADQPPQRVALDTLAASATDEFAPLAAERRLTLVLGRIEPVAVVGAEDALRILLSNLLDNATRYTPAGGRVEVAAWREGAAAMLQVSDNGPGIPEAEHARVFDRFYRVAGQEAEGSGLGLAIARQVVHLHDGRIELGPGLDGRGLAVRVVLKAFDGDRMKTESAPGS